MKDMVQKRGMKHPVFWRWTGFQGDHQGPCWRMRALRDGARPQGDRKGSPLLYTAWGADPSVYSRGGACPRPDRSPMGFNL